MPIYVWKCKKCEEEVEIIRPISQYDDIPKVEEKECSEECDHEWRKVLGTFRKVHAQGYRGRKGSW